MLDRNRLSRRGFVGGVATAMGYLTFKSPIDLWAREQGFTRVERGLAGV